MFFPIFTTIALVFAVFSFYMKRSVKNVDKDNREFWEKELRANSVRRQPLTDIVYIEPDLSALPFDETSTDDNIVDYQNRIRALADKKIVNLSGISNTDLKLKYGAANLDYLSSCDENYMELVKYLYLWANYLLNEGKTAEAKQILEYGATLPTDVKAHYKLLADLYVEEFDFEALDRLTEAAKKIPSSAGEGIVEMLQAINVV